KEHFRTNITGVANATNSSSTLTQNATNIFTKGENWTAAFRINDGTSSSDWVNASINISNTIPENPNTTIFPQRPLDNEGINCTTSYIDTNNDAGIVTLIFYNNSVEHFRTNSSAAGNNTIASYRLLFNNTNIFTTGENWTCAARATDNNDTYTSWVNSSVFIYSSQGLTTGGKKEPGKGSSSSSGFTEKTTLQSIQLSAKGLTYQFNQLAPGLNKIELQDKLLSIESLNIFSSILMNNVEIKIEESDKLPEKYKNIKELSNSYKYIDVGTSNLLESLISEREFVFKLSRSIVSNKEVSLYVHEGNWVKLNTEKLKEEGNFVYYKSTSPHLSLFAIRIYKEETQKTSTISNLAETIVNTSREQLTIKEKAVFSSITILLLILLISFVIALIKSRKFRKIIFYFILLLLIASLIYSFINYNINNPDLTKDFTKKEIISYSILTISLLFFILLYLLFDIRKFFDIRNLKPKVKNLKNSKKTKERKKRISRKKKFQKNKKTKERRNALKLISKQRLKAKSSIYK
ncbi:PGF-pre-PGF domain-containing protein, partial [Candidatus Woesearchaeota archaeon]|nr:PGF-pre-PGF domain-containing protein [Candidatus Woesearchaeota archaeon]